MPEQKIIKLYSADKITNGVYIDANDIIDECVIKYKEEGYYIKQICSDGTPGYIYILFEKHNNKKIK